MAGIASFQQSGLKMSRATRRNGARLGSTRLTAIASDIEPFKSSFKSTAEAAEYWREEGIVVREVCMMIVSAAFCTASVIRLHWPYEKKAPK